MTDALRISDHAIARYIERVAEVSEEAAREALSGPTIRAAHSSSSSASRSAVERASSSAS